MADLADRSSVRWPGDWPYGRQWGGLPGRPQLGGVGFAPPPGALFVLASGLVSVAPYTGGF